MRRRGEEHGSADDAAIYHETPESDGILQAKDDGPLIPDSGVRNPAFTLGLYQFVT